MKGLWEFIYPDEALLTKADKRSHSYAELAALRQRAMRVMPGCYRAGKAPKNEQRLAAGAARAESLHATSDTPSSDERRWLVPTPRASRQ